MGETFEYLLNSVTIKAIVTKGHFDTDLREEMHMVPMVIVFDGKC